MIAREQAQRLVGSLLGPGRSFGLARFGGRWLVETAPDGDDGTIVVDGDGTLLRFPPEIPPTAVTADLAGVRVRATVVDLLADR